VSNFKYGWRAEKNVEGSFWVGFSPCQRLLCPWKEELRLAAISIAESTAKPIWLCLSGGIDSEIMAQTFRDEGIPFSVLTLEHSAGTNSHDVQWAAKWCLENGAFQKVVKLDMEVFLEEDIAKYAAQGYLAPHAYRYFQIRLLEIVEDLGGLAVMGGGEQYYTSLPTVSDRKIFLNFDVGYTAPLEWCRQRNANHVPSFYWRTPELCAAYLQMSVVAENLKPELMINKAASYLLKTRAYHAQFPQLERRPKYNGFEKVFQLRAKSEERLSAIWGKSLQSHSLELAEFKRQLKHESVQPYSEVL
jgi:hypothetical protein